MVTAPDMPTYRATYLFSDVPVQNICRLKFKDTSSDDLVTFLSEVSLAKQRDLAGQESPPGGLDLAKHPELRGRQFLPPKGEDFTLKPHASEANKGWVPARTTLTEGVSKLAAVLPATGSPSEGQVAVLTDACKHINALERQVAALKRQLLAAGLTPAEAAAPEPTAAEPATWTVAGLYTCEPFGQPLCAGLHPDTVRVHPHRDRAFIVKVCARGRPGQLARVLGVLRQLPAPPDVFEAELSSSDAGHSLTVLRCRTPKGAEVALPELEKEIQAALDELAREDDASSADSAPVCTPANAAGA